MAKKGVGMLVRMESSAGTGFRYYKTKSAKAQEKLKMRKYDPWAENPETGKKGCTSFSKKRKCPRPKKLRVVFRSQN
jgi:large subunit ribosomal protein L33